MAVMAFVSDRFKLARQSLSAAYIRLWGEICGPELGKARFGVALACCILSLAIGLGYAQTLRVSGWQLWSWGICILTLVVTLTPRLVLRIDRNWLWLGALFAAALALRLPFLGSIPGGLHLDEREVADFAMRHVF